MSTLTQFSGGGVRQIKTGFIYNAAPTSATPGSTSAEDFFYYDITLTGDAVSDVTKCIIVFDGLGHYNGYSAIVNLGLSGSAVYNTRMVTTRLQNTTTLRLCQQYDATVSTSSVSYYITGRWTLIEYR